MDDKIFRVMMMIADTGQIAGCDAIKHQETLWLVPNWLDSPTETYTRPERIIALDRSWYQDGGKQGNERFDYTLMRPIPKDALYGPSPSQTKDSFVVVLSPEIKFPRRTGIQ